MNHANDAKFETTVDDTFEIMWDTYQETGVFDEATAVKAILQAHKEAVEAAKGEFVGKMAESVKAMRDQLTDIARNNGSFETLRAKEVIEGLNNMYQVFTQLAKEVSSPTNEEKAK